VQLVEATHAALLASHNDDGDRDNGDDGQSSEPALKRRRL
jgi:hypothetical protein